MEIIILIMLVKKIYIWLKFRWKSIQKFIPYPLNEVLEKIFKVEDPYTFKGWQMTTCQATPWGEDVDNLLVKANTAIKERFSFTISHRKAMMDELLWRHWNVSYAIRHAIEFVDKKDLDFVECGVADGITCYIAISELNRQLKMRKINNFRMHLYDSWGPMRAKELIGDEIRKINKFEGLSLERTKKNLSEFCDYTIYHQGYIPESLNKPPPPPSSIAYLHIDLNSSKPTRAVLDLFYPRLLKGGVILFDDYGRKGYEYSKGIINEFFKDKPGILLIMPTGQAIYYR